MAQEAAGGHQEFSDLGSGFRVAALDLEIRGAGNLLGGEQSGHIEAVGFEMYMKLLEQTVRELKGEEIEDEVRASVNLGRLPDRRGLRARHEPAADGLPANGRGAQRDEIARCVDEVRDRYGPLPTGAQPGRLRPHPRDGRQARPRVHRPPGPAVVLKFRENAKVDPLRLIDMVQERADLTLRPPATLKLDLGPRPPAVAPQPDPRRPPFKGVPVRPAKPKRQPAWWAARATTGEVTPGFTKAEILKAAPEDPRAPDGVLAKVTEFLEDLGEP